MSSATISGLRSIETLALAYPELDIFCGERDAPRSCVGASSAHLLVPVFLTPLGPSADVLRDFGEGLSRARRPSASPSERSVPGIAARRT